MIGAALDLMLALSLGCLTLVGLAFMVFSAYLVIFTKPDTTTDTDGRMVFYTGRTVLGLSLAFIMFLLGTFVVQSLR